MKFVLICRSSEPINLVIRRLTGIPTQAGIQFRDQSARRILANRELFRALALISHPGGCCITLHVLMDLPASFPSHPPFNTPALTLTTPCPSVIIRATTLISLRVVYADGIV